MNKDEIVFLIRAAVRQIGMGFKEEDMKEHLKDNVFEAKFDRFGVDKLTKTTLEIKITKQNIGDQK